MATVLRWARIILMALIITAIAIALMTMYNRFRRETAVPSPLPDAGTARLFFDRPSVPASLDVQVDDRSRGYTQIRYLILLDQSYTGQGVRFSLVLSGLARVSETYPDGEPNMQANGCWASVAVILDPAHGNDYDCYKTRLTPDAGYSPPEYRIDTQVISGVLRARKPQERDATVLASLYWSYNTSAGKRTYFTLPSIGTPYAPADFRAEIYADLGRNGRGYVPSRLIVRIDDGALAPTEKFDSVTPEPYKAGRKLWIDLDAAMISAHGSVINTVFEEQAQRDLFLFGAGAGIATTVLPILVEKLWSLIRRPKAPSMEPSIDARRGPSPAGRQRTRVLRRSAELPPGAELLRRRLRQGSPGLVVGSQARSRRIGRREHVTAELVSTWIKAPRERGAAVPADAAVDPHSSWDRLQASLTSCTRSPALL